ncbi:hypothetical protein [Lentimicrobium sp.]|uniref:hypothetical protein n=2 Tax=Lentimicrobium sp. TaxID=2034841 RepID=UPI002D1F9F3B|nr:hypothetical protein [Lentimicrobium sp.]
MFALMNDILLTGGGDLPGYLWIALISSVKFILAVPASYIFGNSFLLTILITSLGGISGILFFHYLSRYVIFSDGFGFHIYFRALEQLTGFTIIPSAASETRSPFGRRNRLLVRLIRRYGLTGIIILTPVLLSIPLGTILTYRFTSGRVGSLIMLCFSVVAWSVVLSATGLFF